MPMCCDGTPVIFDGIVQRQYETRGLVASKCDEPSKKTNLKLTPHK
jgi:hypothetical protein